jgi:hypothetical protein
VKGFDNNYKIRNNDFFRIFTYIQILRFISSRLFQKYKKIEQNNGNEKKKKKKRKRKTIIME